jgi:membrane protease YdiL (CAAX protease family)
LREAAKIVAYFLGVVLLGALLAPLVFRLMPVLEQWSLANGLQRWDPHNSEVLVNGPVTLQTADFATCLERSLVIAAFLLLLPAMRACGIARWRDLRLRPDTHRWSHLGRGFFVAAVLFCSLATGLVLANFQRPLSPHPWSRLPWVALAAGLIAIVQEVVFRGGALGLLLRAMRPFAAVCWTTGIFIVVHFFDPDHQAAHQHVTWFSGFQLLPNAFPRIGDPVPLLSEAVPLLAMGGLLGYARLRTDALWLSVGLAWGAVFAERGLQAFAETAKDAPPWIGADLLAGLAVLPPALLAWVYIWRRLDYEELLPDPKPRD